MSDGISQGLLWTTQTLNSEIKLNQQNKGLNSKLWAPFQLQRPRRNGVVSSCHPELPTVSSTENMYPKRPNKKPFYSGLLQSADHTDASSRGLSKTSLETLKVPTSERQAFGEAENLGSVCTCLMCGVYFQTSLTHFPRFST